MKLNLIILFVVVVILVLCSYSTSQKTGHRTRGHSFLKVNRRHHRRRGKVHRHHKALHSHSVETRKESKHHHSNHFTHASKQHDKTGVETPKTSGELFFRAAPNLRSTTVVLDVGQVTVVSVSQSCNGVLLDPSLVLTSASCVFPNQEAKAYEDIQFVLNGVNKQVKQVIANPGRIQTRERNTDLVLLLLGNPMPNSQGGDSTSLTWSSYALEDIGESLLATPSVSRCSPASRKAEDTDTIRIVGDNLITVRCDNAGLAAPGSPLYRRVRGRNEIYGIYFGQCTSGSLDRKVSGLCGARITKQVFQDFCTLANNENINLPDCSSNLLNSLNGNSPTEIYTNITYAAVASTADNLKGAVIVYYPLSSKTYRELVIDIDSIQRLKLVYDKFQIAIVDTNLLPYDLIYAPFIEFRTAGSDTWLPYSEKYDYKSFKKFMSDFSRVGAPPASKTSFIQHLKAVSKRSTSSSSRLKRPLSSDIEGSSSKFRRLECDPEKGMELTDMPPVCICKPGYMGSGTVGNCQDRDQAIKTNCRYDVEEAASTTATAEGQTLDQIIGLTGQTTWCTQQMFVFSYLVAQVPTVDVSGEDLTPDDCYEAIEDMVICPKEDELSADHLRKYANISEEAGHHHNHSNAVHHHNHSTKSYKRTVGTTMSANFLSNFLNKKPPAGATPNKHSSKILYVFQDWITAAQNKFSGNFDKFRGTPDVVIYQLCNGQMTDLKNRLTTSRRMISNGWHYDTGIPYNTGTQGKNQLYAGRGNKKFPDAVDKGHLNPSQINSFDAKTIKLTHTYTNAYPQYTYFNIEVWKKYEKKLFDYAKGRCQAKSSDSELHLLTGLSDYEIIGNSKSKKSINPTYWPLGIIKKTGLQSSGTVHPIGSRALPANVKPIVQAKSMWTVACCTWSTGSTNDAESVSVWANNKPRGVLNREHQPDLVDLANNLYPSIANFNFFPRNRACSLASKHYTLP